MELFKMTRTHYQKLFWRFWIVTSGPVINTHYMKHLFGAFMFKTGEFPKDQHLTIIDHLEQ